MNREIKFRIFSRTFTEDEIFYDVGCEWKDDGLWWFCNNKTRLFQLASKGFELMQYTGLKDKNGKEIYEGDIMECFLGDELDRVEIYFSSEFAIFDFKPRDSDDTLSDLIFFGYAVIGNIYENPELL